MQIGDFGRVVGMILAVRGLMITDAAEKINYSATNLLDVIEGRIKSQNIFKEIYSGLVNCSEFSLNNEEEYLLKGGLNMNEKESRIVDGSDRKKVTALIRDAGESFLNALSNERKDVLLTGADVPTEEETILLNIPKELVAGATQELKMYFPNLVRKYRDIMNLSQTKVATFLGTTQTIISQMERGQLNANVLLRAKSLLEIFNLQPESVEGQEFLNSLRLNLPNETGAEKTEKTVEENSIVSDARKLNINDEKEAIKMSEPMEENSVKEIDNVENFAEEVSLAGKDFPVSDEFSKISEKTNICQQKISLAFQMAEEGFFEIKMRIPFEWSNLSLTIDDFFFEVMK